MGRNLEENMYIEVPFSRNSPVLARLKEEIAQAQTSTKKKLSLGPYIAEILAKRDGVAQDETLATMTTTSLKEIIEQAIHAALDGATIKSTVEVFEDVDPDEVIREEAAKLAETWGGEDDWGALEK